MERFSISEMYTLELRWDDILYENEGMCKVVGAYFTGPVLSHALGIAANDHILLDFFKQYPILVRGAYVAKFSWGQVKYNKDNTVSLKTAMISHDNLNRVPKLRKSDYIVIDTQNHEEKVHRFNLTYTSYVVNENHVMYNFVKGQ